MALSLNAERLALAVAQGQRIKDAAGGLGMTPEQAWRITSRNNGAFRERVEEIRTRVREAAVAGLVEKIANEGERSVDTLVEIRDNKLADFPSRRGCANDLLDRNPETARIARSETKAQHVIHFGADVVSYLDRVIAERPGQQVVDAEVIAKVPALPAAFEVKPIDDLVDEYEAAT